MKNKIHLVELEFEWNWNWNPEDSRKEREVLENLQPYKHLEKLSIRNYGGTQFPRWLFDNSSLNVLSLKLDCCKYCSCLMMYREVASCLHQSFLHARKQREDTVNFSQVFGGRARKESALLFYEVLVCSICVLRFYSCLMFSLVLI